MNKILSIALICSIGVLSLNAQTNDKVYDDEKPFVKVNVLVADTSAVYGEMKSILLSYNNLLNYIGGKTTDQTILDLVASLCDDPYVLRSDMISSVKKDIAKGKVSYYLGKEVNYRAQKIVRAVQELETHLYGSTRITLHENGNTYIVDTNGDSGYNYGSTPGDKHYDGYSMIDESKWYPYFDVVGREKDLPTKMIERTIKNKNYRPAADEKTLDNMDILQQNVGYEWLFSESHSHKKTSYPIEMAYELYDSHPDLRISGNGIYNSEGKLLRIILLRREEPWGMVHIDNLEVSDVNGTLSLDEGIDNEGKAIEDKILSVLYANDYNHNKYGIKDNLDTQTKYAIENLVGIQSKSQEIEEMSLQYSAASFINDNSAIKARMTQKQLADFKAEWAKVSKYKPMIDAHNQKMKNDKARRWYQQVVSDHNTHNLKCYKIKRLSDLSFLLEYGDNSTQKVILKAVVEFYSAPSAKNSLNYKWKIIDQHVIE